MLCPVVMRHGPGFVPMLVPIGPSMLPRPSKIIFYHHSPGGTTGEWCDFQQNKVWIDSLGVQEDLHSGLDLMIMYAKPHQMTLSLRNEELSLRNMLLYIDSM